MYSGLETFSTSKFIYVFSNQELKNEDEQEAVAITPPPTSLLSSATKYFKAHKLWKLANQNIA